MNELHLEKIPLTGYAGIYFLYQGDEVVFIGSSRNCFLRVAQHAKYDSKYKFSHWSFVSEEDQTRRIQTENEFRKKLSPQINRPTRQHGKV